MPKPAGPCRDKRKSIVGMWPPGVGDILSMSPVVELALQLVPRGALWAEMDLAVRERRIPPERMKANQEHSACRGGLGDAGRGAPLTDDSGVVFHRRLLEALTWPGVRFGILTPADGNDREERGADVAGFPVVTERDTEDGQLLEELLALDDSLVALMSDIGGDKASGDVARSIAADRRLDRLARNRKTLDGAIRALKRRLASLPKRL